jgi:hypothetical protein
MRNWRIYSAIIFALLLSISASFIEYPTLRITTNASVFILIFTVGYFFIRKHIEDLKNGYKLQIRQNVSEIEKLLKPFERPLHDKALLIPILVNQLQEVTQQTESAALDIGGRFMNIIERARKNTSDATVVLEKLTGQENRQGSNAIELSKKALSDVIQSLQESIAFIRKP